MAQIIRNSPHFILQNPLSAEREFYALLQNCLKVISEN